MTAIAVIFGIAAVIWGLVLAVRGSLLIGCVIYLIAASCFGPHFLQFDAAGVTLTLDRLYLLGLVGACGVKRLLGAADPKPWQAADLWLAALLALLTASAFSHDWRAPQPGTGPILQHLINGYFIPLAIYWIARQSILDERRVAACWAALGLFGAYLAVIGILEAAGAWPLIFPSYIADPSIGLHFGRARGPMIHSVSYGLYLCSCLAALALVWERSSRPVRAAVGAAAAALMAALFFTKTRTVWMGAATAGLTTLGVMLPARWRGAALATAVAAGLVVGVVKMDAILGLQREGTVQDTRKSASMRASFTYVSWLMFKERPLFGFGFGQFPRAKLAYLDDRSVDIQLNSIREYVHHNTFLSILTETGLTGLALLLGTLAAWARAAWLLMRNPTLPLWMRRQGLLLMAALGAVFWQMVGHEITFTPLDHSLVWMIAGMSVGLHAAVRRRAAASGRQVLHEAPVCVGA